MHLRDASERVRVLDLVGIGVVALLERGSRQKGSHLGGDGRLARVRSRAMVGSRERHVRPEQRLDAHRRDDACGLREPIGIRE